MESQQSREVGGDVSGSRPNIVLILADDMGFSDIGAFGSEIATPHLDELAANGLRMSQAYNNARCCPTRASLMTGLYPHQAGIGHMINDLGHDPSYQGYLNDRCVTIGEALRNAGYRTLMSGKWHLGGQYELDPSTWRPGSEGFPTPHGRGFDHHWGFLTGACSYFDPHTLIENDQVITDIDDDFYLTDAITENALRMLDATAGDDHPFFLYLAHFAPHWPLHAREEDIELYRGRYREGWDAVREARFKRLRESGVISDDIHMSPRDPYAPPWEEVEDPDWEAERMAVYAAQVHRLDLGVGAVVEKLRSLGKLDNTLIIFISDNGGCAELFAEDGQKARIQGQTKDGTPVRKGNITGLAPGAADTYMSYDLPWANVSNTPFRLYKHWVHEGGISSPFIAHWPAVIGPGRLEHAPIHVIDYMATFLDLAGTDYPSDHNGHAITPLEGESFAPLLSGISWERANPIFWEHEGNRAVRDGRWKLVSKYPGEWELYDMECDRSELEDLSPDHPDRVASMASWYEQWAQRCGVVSWDTTKSWVPSNMWWSLLPVADYYRDDPDVAAT